MAKQGTTDDVATAVANALGNNVQRKPLYVPSSTKGPRPAAASIPSTTSCNKLQQGKPQLLHAAADPTAQAAFSGATAAMQQLHLPSTSKLSGHVKQQVGVDEASRRCITVKSQ